MLLMWMKMRRAREARKARERAVLPRRSACGPCGGRFSARVPLRDHFVVGEQRAVEQHHVGARQAARASPAPPPRARHEGEPRTVARQLDADIGRALIVERGSSPSR